MARIDWTPLYKIWVDVEEFDRLVSAAADSQANNHLDEAFEFFRAAKRLYRADFLSDATGLDWATAERHRLRTRYIVLCNQLATLHAARGEPRCAIAVLERVLAKDPWNEDSARIMMQCYVEMGQLSLALRVFKSCEGALERELGVRPAAETLKLYRRILAEPGSARHVCCAPTTISTTAGRSPRRSGAGPLISAGVTAGPTHRPR